MMSTKSKRKFFRFILFLVIVLLFFNLIFYVLFQTKLLKVNEIEIKDLNLINKELAINLLIKEIIKTNVLRGLIGPDNLLFWFQVRPEKFIDNLIYFNDVKINVDFINKKINLVFSEKNFFGIYCVINYDCYFFDKNGVIIQKAPVVEGSLIFKIEDENERNLVLGQKIFYNSNYLNNILTTVQAIKENNFLIKEILIKDLKFKEFYIILSNNLIFKFSLEKIPENFKKILGELKSNLNFNDLKYLDFRVENRVYYK